MAKQKGEKEIPVPRAASSLPLIGYPFVFQYINRVVLDGKCSTYNKRKSAANMIRRSEVKKAKYLLYLLYVGKELQRSLGILETKRQLDVGNLKGIIELGAHAAFASENVNPHNKKIDDKSFPVWNIVLNDLLLAVRAHLTEFMSAYQLTQLPDYSSMFPSQE